MNKGWITRNFALLCTMGMMSSYMSMGVMADTTRVVVPEVTKDETTSDTNSDSGETSTTESQPLYNDPIFKDQYYFYDCNILPIHERRVSTETVKVGVYDSSFGDMSKDNVNWSQTLPGLVDEKDLLFSGNHGSNVADVVGMKPNDGIAGVGIVTDVELVPFSSAYREYDGYNPSDGAIKYCMDNDIKVLMSSVSFWPDKELYKEFCAHSSPDDFGGIFIYPAHNSEWEQIIYYDENSASYIDTNEWYHSASYEELDMVLGADWRIEEHDDFLKILSQDMDSIVPSLRNFDLRLYSYNTEDYNTIIVTGYDADGTFSAFNWGKNRVTIGAPSGFVNYSFKGYGHFGATSGACPIVGATVALLLSCFPTASTSQIREAIVKSAFYNKDFDGKCSTNGTLNAYGAMLELERMLLSEEYGMDPSQVITDGEYYIRPVGANSDYYLSYKNVRTGGNTLSLSTDEEDTVWKVEITKDLHAVIMPVGVGDLAIECYQSKTGATNAYVKPFTEANNQKWDITYSDDGRMFITSVSTGFQMNHSCKPIFSMSRPDDVVVNMWEIIPASDNVGIKQPEFSPVYKTNDEVPADAPSSNVILSADTTYTIQNALTGEYLCAPRSDRFTDPDFGAIDGFRRHINPDNYKWQFVQEGNYYFIRSARYPDLCLDVAWAETTLLKTSINMDYYANNNFISARFKVTALGDNQYTIVSKMWDDQYMAYNDTWKYAPRYYTQLCALRVLDDVPECAIWIIKPIDPVAEYDNVYNPKYDQMQTQYASIAESSVNTAPTPVVTVAPSYVTIKPEPTPVPQGVAGTGPLVAGEYRICTSSSGQYMTYQPDTGYVTVEGLDVSKCQTWTIGYNSSGNYVIKPSGTDLALDVHAKYETGSNIVELRAFDDGIRQEWVIYKRDDGSYEIQAVWNSFYCINSSGSNLAFWNVQKESSPANRWVFVKVD